MSVEQVAVPGTTASCCRAFALQYIRLLTNLGEPSHQVQALRSAQQSLQLCPSYLNSSELQIVLAHTW